MIFLFFLLNTEKCVLKIDTNPTDAKIYINKIYQGNTPATIEGFDENKKYYIVIEKEGYEPYSDSIMFSAPIRFKELKIVLREKSKINIPHIDVAKIDAEQDVDKKLWMLLGAVGGLGILLNELTTPDVPDYRLKDKSGEDLFSYIENYKKEKKKIQRESAFDGCIGCGCLFLFGCILIGVAF